MALKDTLRYCLKKVWKALPPAAHARFLEMLCLWRMDSRGPAAEAPAATVYYVVGNFQAGGGISRSAALYAGQMLREHRQCILVDSTREMLQSVKNPITDGSLRALADIREDGGGGTVIIHLNPPQFLWLLCRLGRNFFRHKQIIAYWAWELEDIPALWKFALRYVDAVEAPSTFTQVAVARNTQKTVSVRPHVLPLPDRVKPSYALDGIVRCLFVFDMTSLCSRKNPQAAIAAFARAFSPDEASLTIKASQIEADGAAWKNLQALAAPHAHIHLMDDWLDAASLDRLFLEHDVYLSLHRSEGYGLTIREAMLRNLYIVATGWSGNMDFMQGDRVFPVPYRLTPVKRSDGTFGSVHKARWAEPDVDKAAEILKHIYTTLVAGDKKAKTGGGRL